MLFVDDRHAERPERHLVLDQGVRADHDQRPAAPDLGDGRSALGRRRPLHERDHAHAERHEQLGEADQVLRCQRLGRCHERPLPPALDRAHQGMCGHGRLAGADVAL
jgi:hypothetical protein